MTQHSEVILGDEAWAEIEGLLGEIVELSKSELEATDFYREVLDRVIQATAASGGAVWQRDAANRWVLQHQVQLIGSGLVDTEAARSSHGLMLNAVSELDEPSAVPPRSGLDSTATHNPSDHLLVLLPVRFDGTLPCILELLQRPDLDPAALRGNQALLNLVAESCAEFHRNRRLRALRHRDDRNQLSAQFARAVHQTLTLPATGYEVANEARRLLECDRVSVAIQRHGDWQILAVSGADSLDRRSNTVRHLGELVRLVAASREPLRYVGDHSQLPPQLEQAVRAYVDLQHARTLIVLPLASEQQPPTSALIVESFAHCELDQELLRDVSEHSRLALNNAREYDTLPLLWLLRGVRRAVAAVRQCVSRTLAAGLILLGLAAVLTFVPVEFTVKVRGELQPLERRNVFASADAVVDRVDVRHDQLVEPEASLIQLQSRELDLELQELLGENEQTRQRLLAVTAEKLQISREDAADPNLLNRLTAQETELQQLLDSQQRQLRILREQISALTLRSPLRGRVLTWNVRELLQGRPVVKGQALMAVANVDGPWVLELMVPVDQIGHVLRSPAAGEGNQRVSYILRSQPGISRTGTVREISRSVASSEDEEAAVRVTVDVDRETIGLPRPGTTVVARIECGHRSLGYYWLHGIWEALQTYVLF